MRVLRPGRRRAKFLAISWLGGSQDGGRRQFGRSRTRRYASSRAGTTLSAEENRATFVEPFLIGRTPVTNRQYAQYLEAIQRSDSRRSDWALSEIFCDLPAVDLSWREARAYCDWFSDAHGVSCGLPTAVEWEAAARGKQGLLFPWGMTFEPGHCLSLDEHSPGPVPVGSFASGASPCGALDMVGLVWQWTETLEASGEAVLKGGSWMDAAWGLRNNRFILSDPDRVAFNTGFRICIRSISEGRNG